jgi:hypothetical protein
MRRLAPPFVATFALACSSKPAPVVAVAAPATSASTAAPPSEEPVEAIYADSGLCHRAPSAEVVDCPKRGPTLLLPEKTSVELAGGGHVYVSEGSFTCRKTFPTSGCPAGASCNPPPPRDVECPPELRPRLAPGVQPSKKDGDKCKLADILVVCPEP